MHEFFGRSKLRPVPVEVAKVFLKRVLRTLANLVPFISPELWEVHPRYRRWDSWDRRFSSCYGLWLVNGCLRNLWPIKTQFRYLYDPRNPRAEISLPIRWGLASPFVFSFNYYLILFCCRFKPSFVISMDKQPRRRSVASAALPMCEDRFCGQRGLLFVMPNIALIHIGINSLPVPLNNEGCEEEI